MDMRCTIIVTLATLLAFGKHAHAHQTYYLMGEEDKIHLDTIFNEIDKLDHLIRVEHAHFPAYSIGTNGYVNESAIGASDMLDMYSTFSYIARHYKKMRKFESAQWENMTQLNLAKAQVLTGKDVKSMERVNLKLFGEDDLISRLALVNQLHQYTCNTPQSPQLFLYAFYVNYLVHELKAHALVEWAWLLLRKFGQGGSVEEEQASREAYKRTEGTLPKIKELMSLADRSVWRCDPWKHEAGVTYEEVTRLLQGYVENEVDLNDDGTCRRDCGYYKSARNEGCFDSEFCSEQPKCSGGVHDCRFVESNMQICQAEKNSSRRYEFIEYQSGLVHGNQKPCGTRNSAKSWNRWLFVECSYCLCLCDDQSARSDRYFNLRPVIADVENNRVVTGLRFVKSRRIFHLQVQEGQLLPLGVINETTLQWKPLDAYSISDKDVTEHADYHTLSYEKRALDLGDLKADNSAVVTGLRFRVVGAHLQLEAQFSALEFESGKLIDPKRTSQWTSLGASQHREKLPLKDAQVSSKSPELSIPYPSDNQYIEFTNTGFVEDAAQTTVPFIDIQDVVSEPAVPLSGIGIYYKGLEGYGGFLAPRITTYDFTPYVHLPTWESMHSKDAH